MLHEFAWGAGLDDCAQHALVETHTFVVDIGAGLAPKPQRFLIASELHADFLQQRVGGVFNGRESFLAHQLISRNPPSYTGDNLG